MIPILWDDGDAAAYTVRAAQDSLVGHRKSLHSRHPWRATLGEIQPAERTLSAATRKHHCSTTLYPASWPQEVPGTSADGYVLGRFAFGCHIGMGSDSTSSRHDCGAILEARASARPPGSQTSASRTGRT